MKIRIRENALRIRITQLELKDLVEGKKVVSTIRFPNGTQLTYGLTPANSETTSIQYLENIISIRMGTLDMETMAKAQSVGVQSVHQAGEHTLELLVEKDFTCLHPRGAEDYDTFPNPNQKELG